MIDEASNDWQRGDLEGGLGLVVGRDIVYTQEHRVGNWAGVEEMPELYNVWDGLLYLSGGEGFGLPAWEAMICGLPVIYTNYSGHAEFLARKKECFPVGGVLQPENETCIFRMIADVAQTLEAVLTLLRRSQERGRITKTAFFEPYTSRKVAESWHNCFGEVLRCKSEAGK
ncbi:MAG TPA: glycosyltransferase [Verrucomicrobiae bacterium]